MEGKAQDIGGIQSQSIQNVESFCVDRVSECREQNYIVKDIQLVPIKEVFARQGR